jgi:predicted RNA-binding protein
MCQTVACILKDGKEITVLEDVVSVIPVGSNITLTNLFGDEKTVQGKIYRIDLLSHRILIDSPSQT